MRPRSIGAHSGRTCKLLSRRTYPISSFGLSKPHNYFIHHYVSLVMPSAYITDYCMLDIGLDSIVCNFSSTYLSLICGIGY